ncbi:MAG: hypothetical protein EXR66_08985 [Dehalococcoidia bacterium]|nr:hypothetical protein [Dehalococcoidia bacterium]
MQEATEEGRTEEHAGSVNIACRGMRFGGQAIVVEASGEAPVVMVIADEDAEPSAGLLHGLLKAGFAVLAVVIAVVC